MKKPLLLFSGMAILLSLFGAAAAMAGGGLVEGRGFSRITLAVADESEDSMMPQIMTYLSDMEDIRSYIRPVMVSPSEVRAMVASGDAAAALILPAGFLDSVYRGENFSPLLVLDADRPLEVFGLSLLAESAGSMLINAQKGSFFIQAACQEIQPAGLDFDRMLWEVDMKYALWVLSRGDMYRRETVSPTGGAMTAPQHYLLSSLLFFSFLAPVGILYPIYSWRRQASWLRRLRSAGKPLSVYALSQILWGAIALFLMLALVLCGLAAALLLPGSSLPDPAVAGLLSSLTPHLSLSILPGLLLTALFLSAFAFLCCGAGHIFTAVSLDFVLAGAFLIISGGFIPAALLPDRINALSPFSPLTWMRDMLSPLYLPRAGTPPPSAGFLPAISGFRLAAAALLLIVAALLYGRRFGRQGGAGL